MHHPRSLQIADYTYPLPDDRIAKHPLAERDASKLLIYKDQVISEDIYRSLADHIPKGSLMVFNQTKVVHARLLFKKPTGGAIEVFCLSPAVKYPDMQTAMSQKGHVLWECLVGGAGKWKPGTILTAQHLGPEFTLSAEIADRTDGAFVLRLFWNKEDLTFAEILHHAGKVPLPPYLNREVAPEDEARYQTVFAKEEGSVAAPTAGLHFTDRLLSSLQAKNIDSTFVTLHVGAGTFRPVKSETMEGHDMHAEWIEVSQDAIHQLLAHQDDKIIAIGTTSLRTIESLYWIGYKIAASIPLDLQQVAVHQWDPYESERQIPTAVALSALLYYMQEHHLEKLITRTQILIAPGYTFKIARGLITNFHQPQSTLLLLVSAITGNKWREIYNYALEHNYRFLSYGDGSLLWM